MSSAIDKNKSRYSDGELNAFKQLIEAKLVKARDQLNNLQEQMLEMTDNNSDEHGGDWIDDSSYNSTMEMLNTMAIRQRKHIRDLENALIRIRNKTYGVCVISGELINKNRLMAVPTTTKSLLSKNIEQQKAVEKNKVQPSSTPYIKSESPKIITRVVRKSFVNPSTSNKERGFEEEDDKDLFNDTYEKEDNIYLDELPTEENNLSKFDI